MIGSAKIFASNKEMEPKRSEETMVRARAGFKNGIEACLGPKYSCFSMFYACILLEANSLVDPSDLRNTSSLELAQDYFQLSL